ncbi:hypothetical protein KIN20_014862 [Parelaphostrongylus tenuis]|uniref:G-protein coupled receptors family 1 profile domain-containing protein n=1 Tax=Parelaphostrongylus tenuis TaxID=148309 RepID=A0AAD5MZW0_PARTN|nr:hypothetical protein KIN20_014862 [Parelaphostrongylus tenuis]
MLVAITTEFLLFNLLAFANNVLELTGAYGHSQLETLLVEVSALLVNINGASTIVIYLVFGSKYRSIFMQIEEAEQTGALGTGREPAVAAVKSSTALLCNQCKSFLDYTDIYDKKNTRSINQRRLAE